MGVPQTGSEYWGPLREHGITLRSASRPHRDAYTALATGYVSRTVYFWIGGKYRNYMRASGDSVDRAGDLAMYSFVFSYRPAYYREDYPRPDWRLFIEAVREYSARNRCGEGLCWTAVVIRRSLAPRC